MKEDDDQFFLKWRQFPSGDAVTNVSNSSVGLASVRMRMWKKNSLSVSIGFNSGLKFSILLVSIAEREL